MFLYQHVPANGLGVDYFGRFAAERARRPVRVPTVLSPAAVGAVLEALPPGSMHRLGVELPDGAGLRPGERRALRGRGVDFDRGQVVVRDVGLAFTTR